MKNSIIFLILVMSVALLWSAEYTLSDLLDAAMDNSTRLKQARLSFERSRRDLSSTRINYLPDLSASISRTENYDNIRFERAGDSQYTSHSMSFSVSKSISLANNDYFTDKTAIKDFSLAEISFELQMNNIIYQIITNYINVLENQKRLELYDKDIKIQESIVSESTLLFRQNKITQFQLQQSEINLLNARINSLNAQNNLNDSRKRLFDLINIMDEGWDLAEVDLYADETGELFHRELNYDQILEVREQELTVEKHKTNLTRSKLRFFPITTLSYNYSRSASGSKDLSFDPANYSTGHTIGLRLGYSLNDLFGEYYTHKNLKSLEEHNNLNTAQLLQDITLQYNKLFEELDYLQQMQVLQENRLEQTSISLEMAQQRYRLGLLTQLDLDRASNDFLQTSLDLERNRYQLILKKLEIDKLLSRKLGVRS